jgi:hypothetical protein
MVDLTGGNRGVDFHGQRAGGLDVQQTGRVLRAADDVLLTCERDMRLL